MQRLYTHYFIARIYGEKKTSKRERDGDTIIETKYTYKCKSTRMCTHMRIYTCNINKHINALIRISQTQAHTTKKLCNMATTMAQKSLVIRYLYTYIAVYIVCLFVRLYFYRHCLGYFYLERAYARTHTSNEMGLSLSSVNAIVLYISFNRFSNCVFFYFFVIMRRMVSRRVFVSFSFRFTTEKWPQKTFSALQLTRRYNVSSNEYNIMLYIGVALASDFRPTFCWLIFLHLYFFLHW